MMMIKIYDEIFAITKCVCGGSRAVYSQRRSVYSQRGSIYSRTQCLYFELCDEITKPRDLRGECIFGDRPFPDFFAYAN